MPSDFLYTNFLEDKRIYNLARAFWKRFFDKLSSENDLEYIQYINQFQHGKLEYDGNPIFSAYVPKLNRAVRIIQVAPEGEDPDISAWIDSIELEEGKPPVDELVVDLVLSQRAREVASRVIEEWLVRRCSPGEIDMVLQKTLETVRSGKFRKRRTSKSHNLSQWDHFILDTLNHSQKALTGSELFKGVTARASRERNDLMRGMTATALNRNIKNLSRRSIISFHHVKGRRPLYGLKEWAGKDGKIKEEFLK